MQGLILLSNGDCELIQLTCHTKQCKVKNLLKFENITACAFLNGNIALASSVNQCFKFTLQNQNGDHIASHSTKAKSTNYALYFY